MSAIGAFGITGDPLIADILDNTIRTFRDSGSFAKYSHCDATLESAIHEGFASISDTGEIIPSIKGLCLCSFNGKFNPLIADIFRKIVTARGERHIDILHRTPEQWTLYVLASAMSVSNWYGYSIKISPPDEILFTPPIWCQIAASFSVENALFAVPHLLGWVSHASATINTNRTLDEINRSERNFMLLEVARELQNKIIISNNFPEWIKRAAKDNFEQGDSALLDHGNSALFYYSNSIEAFVMHLSQTSGFENCINSCLSQGIIDSGTASKLHKIRVFRNGVHPGKARYMSSFFTLNQAIEARKYARLLSIKI